MSHYSNRTSRLKILSKLKENTGHNWTEEWLKNIEDGNAFANITDLLASFRDELEELRGEVFLEKDQGALIGKLSELIRKRQWKQIFCGDEFTFQKLSERGIPLIAPDDNLTEIEVGISGCESLIALTGSVLVSSKSGAGRRMNVFPPVHIIIARRSQLVETIGEGFEMIEKYYPEMPSQISLISGPSRTADIEKTLVMGAHGPKELIVFIDLES